MFHWITEIFLEYFVLYNYWLDVTMQAVKVNNSSSSKNWRDQGHSSEKYYKLTIGKKKEHMFWGLTEL